MKREINYIIEQKDAGIRVEQFLRRQGYSRQNLTELKHMPENITVNQLFSPMKRRLSEGDRLTVHIEETVSSQKILPVRLPLEILYEDEDIIVLNKPAGMPTHPSMNNYTNSLANALAWYYQEQNKPFVFRCCNRLDRDTSGVIPVSKHLVSASILSAQTIRGEVSREYLAIARGSVTPPQGVIDAPLGRKNGSIIERTIDWEKGERAVTRYRLLEEKNGYSLLSLYLETGRTHQIRIHMKHLGFPLIGDYLYNPDMEAISRQALHSYRMTFLHPVTKKEMTFTAPLPEDMQKVLGNSQSE